MPRRYLKAERLNESDLTIATVYGLTFAITIQMARACGHITQHHYVEVVVTFPNVLLWLISTV